jgi:glycosyltransferase involved in cell wall biosynthesis
MTLDVSVVVPTFHRDELLRRCLAHLAVQDLPRDRFEVIVVDDGRSATTEHVIEAVRAEHDGLQVRLLPGLGKGPANARNIGWRAASAPVIAFTDDDAFPADDAWLSTGLRYFDSPSVQAVSGRVQVPADDPPTDFQRNVMALEDAEFLTCNAFCRRSSLEVIGGFDERFLVPFREDSDLQFRLEAIGEVLLRREDLRVTHPAPRGRFAISLRLQRYSMFNALLYRKHPDRYRQMQPHPPLRYYGTLLALSVAALGARRRRRGLLLGGLSAWAMLYGAFLGRRLRSTSHQPVHLADMALTSLLIPLLSVYWRLRGAVKFRVLFF